MEWKPQNPFTNGQLVFVVLLVLAVVAIGIRTPVVKKFVFVRGA